MERNHYLRNKSVSVRNLSESSDFHDVCKMLLRRMLGRKYKKAEYIYTEHNPDKPNEDYPDITLKVGKWIYVIELQKEVTKEWVNQILEKHNDSTLIIVELKKIHKEWIDEILFHTKEDLKFDPIDLLRRILEAHVPL